MELELGLKITKTREDVSSSVDFRFSKDPFGPLVLSRETDSRFIIIIHLKGFKKEGIEIEISKEGDRITIQGRKPVEEMVMIRWMAWKKEVEFRVFKKVFKIPDTVDLDKIKARFDDDDATLTITMPKRVKGISGFNIEEEEEERVDFGDVSEAEHKEETEKGHVEEESIERQESDVHSEKFETEIQKEEEFEDIMENKERESQVLEGEEKRFSGGLEEEEFGEKDSQVLGEEQKDEYLEKSHQSDEQDNNMERMEEAKELAGSNKESENSSILTKPGDIEGRDSHEQTIHDEQENNLQLVQQESESDDFGSRAFKEIEEQEHGEQEDTTSESKAREKKKTEDVDDGLRKVQGSEERERRNDESKIQDMVQGGGEEKKKIIKTEIKNGDPKEDVEARVGQGFTPRTQVVREDDIAENETKADGFESDEVDKIHELVEKKDDQGEKAKVRRQREESEDRSLIRLKEDEEQHSKGQKPQGEQQKIKELVEEKTPKAETDIRNDIPKPVQEIEVPEVNTSGKTGDEVKEGKDKQNIVKKDIKKGAADEEIGAKMGEIFALDVADTAMKSEDFECDKLESDEVDKIQKLVEKKNKQEENAKVGVQSADISLTKLQETGEQQFQGQKRDDKQEEIKELVEKQAPEAETNIGNDNLKPVQETCEGEHKIQKLFLEETRNQQEKYKEKIMETGKKTNDDAGTRKVQEIMRQQELDEPARSDQENKTRQLVKSKTNDEEKEIAGTETKEQESDRPKILREQEKIQEVAEDKTNLSKNGIVNEDKEIGEKKTEFGDDDDISRKVRDVAQRDSDAMKGQEEKDMIQELVLEDKVSDGSKGIITVVGIKAENVKSKKVQEIDKQQSHEEDKEDISGKQETLLGGEIIGGGEVEDVKNKKKTTETEKRVQDRTREAQETEKKDSDVSGKYIKGTMIQEKEENRGIDRNEHEEEKQDEADIPAKRTGTIEQELGRLNSQLEQDNVEEKTQEPVTEKIKDSKEEEGSEESKNKTDDDDVVRKVTGITEQELYEPTREHVSKVKELVEEKTGHHEKQQEQEIAEPEIEAECGSLGKVDGIEEQELHEPKIHKERDKTRITGAEEPSGLEEEKVVESMKIVGGENYSEEQELHEPKVHKERDKTRKTEAVERSGEDEEKIVEPMRITEKKKSIDVQEIKKERPDKPESHEKGYKNQEVVEAGNNDSKEEEQEEKVMDKAKPENEEESSKKVYENEQQDHDELKRSMIQDKMQQTEETDKTRAMEENEIVERTENKDGSLKKVQDDEDPEFSKPYKRQKEDKIQEDKIQEDKVLKHQEAARPDLTELERHGELKNIPQLVEEKKVENIADLGGTMEDDSTCKFHESEEGKSYEDWTQEEREKRKYLVKEEANDTKDKHTGGENHNDYKKEEQEEKVIAKAELKTEEDSSKKGQAIEKQEYDELKRSMVRDRMQETEKKDKTRAMDENEILERRPKTKDGSLRKVREGEDPELNKQKRQGKEDMIQETGESESHNKQRKIHQSVEDIKGEGIMENISEPGVKLKGDSSDKFHGFQKKNSYEDWKQKESEEIKNLVKEEATDSEDKHTRGEGEHEEERYEKIAETKAKVGNEINKKVGVDKEEPESDKQYRYGKLDKFEGVLRERTSDCGKEEGNLVDDLTTKIQETEKEKLHELEMHEKQAIVPDIVEDDIGDQEYEEIEEAADVVASNENGSSRKVQKTEEEEEREESEKQKEQNTIPETSDPDMKEKDQERVAEKETKEEAPNTRSVREIKELEANVQELEGKTENSKDGDGEGRRGEKGKQGKTVDTMSHERFTSKSDDSIMRKILETNVQEPNEKKNQERKGKIEDESLRKGQDFLEKESTVSKRRPVEHEKIQELKEVEKRDRVNEDEGKAKAETKFDDDKSRKFEMSKRLELDESEFNKEQKKILKPLEERSNAPKKPKEGNEKIAEEEMQDMIDSRVMEQEMKKTADDVSSRKVQQIKDELERHQKPSEIPEKHIIKESVEERTQERGEGENKAVIKTESNDSSQSPDVEEKGSYQPKRYAEQELMTEEDGKEEYHIREGEQNEMAKKSDDKEAKEGNRAGSVWREGETQIRDDTSIKAKENKKQEKSMEQRLRDNLKDEETAKTEAKSNDNETRKSHQIKEEVTCEQERLKEQGRIKELVENRTHCCRETEFEDDCSKKIQERDKEESTEPGRDEKREKIQEPVDRETSEDDEEELEIEFEDEEEDWEAEVIQETDSDEDNNKIRKIKRIRLGFRLVGGSTLFMSLIVIVISFIHSKRKIRCYKF